MKFYIVDVFAREKYAGNPLAVVLDGETLTTEQMQAIAREMNYSETTFIVSGENRNGGYDVRIFTPTQELPFAGHPTLGTAYIIGREILGEFPDEVKLNLGVGQISVTGDGSQADCLWMQQNPPSFGRTLSPGDLAPVLNVQPEAIDTRFPIQEVSTGIPFLIVPLNHLLEVRGIKIERDRYFRLIEGTDAKSIFVFCPETYEPENDLNARMFADYLGVPEDPATGSANGCLAGYLVEHAYFGKDEVSVRVEQGYEILRPSLLLLEAKKLPQTIQVRVGGRVIPVAVGELI